MEVFVQQKVPSFHLNHLNFVFDPQNKASNRTVVSLIFYAALDQNNGVLQPVVKGNQLLEIRGSTEELGSFSLRFPPASKIELLGINLFWYNGFSDVLSAYMAAAQRLEHVYVDMSRVKNTEIYFIFLFISCSLPSKPRFHFKRTKCE